MRAVARRGPAGASPSIQLTRDAVSVCCAELLARADDDPRGRQARAAARTSACRSRGRVPCADRRSADAGRGAGRATRPLVSTISPAAGRRHRAGARRSRRRRRPERSRSRGCRACRRPPGRDAPACARTSALRQVADGKHRVRELILRQREQKIRLVLVAVGAAPQPVPPRVLVERHASVVAGGDGRGVEARRPARQASRT